MAGKFLEEKSEFSIHCQVEARQEMQVLNIFGPNREGFLVGHFFAPSHSSGEPADRHSTGIFGQDHYHVVDCSFASNNDGSVIFLEAARYSGTRLSVSSSVGCVYESVCIPIGYHIEI